MFGNNGNEMYWPVGEKMTLAPYPSRLLGVSRERHHHYYCQYILMKAHESALPFRFILLS
jgi:hypothetical protein